MNPVATQMASPYLSAHFLVSLICLFNRIICCFYVMFIYFICVRFLDQSIRLVFLVFTFYLEDYSFYVLQIATNKYKKPTADRESSNESSNKKTNIFFFLLPLPTNSYYPAEKMHLKEVNENRLIKRVKNKQTFHEYGSRSKPTTLR